MLPFLNDLSRLEGSTSRSFGSSSAIKEGIEVS
jgi:hypothetical protein